MGDNPSQAQKGSAMNENQKEDERLKSLREEYSNLFSLIQHYYTSPYNVIPIGVTLLGAMTLYGAAERGSDSSKGLWGVVVCYSMVPLAIWQSYIHNLLCIIGIRLVKVERLINGKTGATDKNGIGFFSKTVGQGYTSCSGLAWTTIITCGFSFVVFCFAAKLGRHELHQKFPDLAECCGWLIILVPLVAIIALVLGILVTEYKTGQEKRELLADKTDAVKDSTSAAKEEK